MFKCNDCSRQFEDPEYIREREMIDYGIGRSWVTLFEGNVCPYCESHDIEEFYEDDDTTEPDEVVGVGLQQAEATADDRQGVA
jgi:DNA-directed RNA polymerase subunit RPC12/RpoP